MSTIKVQNIQHTASSTNAIALASDGTCTANITNRSNRNLIINGAMEVAQRGTSSNSAGYQTVDRFTTSMAGTDEAATFAQVDVASGTTPYTQGFRKAFKVTNGNQTSGAGAADDLSVSQYIESQNIAQSGWDYTSSSSFITLSFWVKSSVAQTFFCGIRLYGSDQREFCFSYTLSADTWTKVTKSISGAAGLTILNDNTLGAFIQWPQFWGTNYTSSGRTVDTWQVKNNASNYPDYTSTWYTTNDATWELTGVQLEVGSVATDFEHLSYANELTRCERYYQLIAPSVAEALISDTIDYGNTTYFTCDLHTPMRIAPSLVVGDHADAFRLYGTNPRNVNTFLANTGVTTPSKIQLYATGGSSGAVGFARVFKNTSGNQSGGTYATIAVNAEL